MNEKGKVLDVEASGVSELNKFISRMREQLSFMEENADALERINSRMRVQIKKNDNSPEQPEAIYSDIMEKLTNLAERFERLNARNYSAISDLNNMI